MTSMFWIICANVVYYWVIDRRHLGKAHPANRWIYGLLVVFALAISWFLDRNMSITTLGDLFYKWAL